MRRATTAHPTPIPAFAPVFSPEDELEAFVVCVAVGIACEACPDG